MSNEYNGWSNYETWQAALWLNEIDFLGHCQENGFSEIDAEMVEHEIYELAGAEDMTDFAKDIYNSWVSCANFHEIADTFNMDLRA